MHLISLLFALLLIAPATYAVEDGSANGITPTQCGPADSGSPCGGAGPASQGNTSDTNQGAGNPINLITGNKYQQEVDLPALPGVLGLEIVRHYNSSLADARTPPGITGRGWRLSYETDLYAIGNTLQIMQADGTRIIFIRNRNNPNLCATNNPANGTVTIQQTPRGEEYVWTWTNGRTLSFNAQGKLSQIKAPTGEFVSLTHDLTGALVKVTDPQGRSLVLGYPQRMHPDRFNGVTHIESPVGRFIYAYGSAVPKAYTGNPRDLLANLIRVDLPNKTRRHYHYEDPAHATLLTGLSVAGQGKPQRISTWAYDSQGRGILSVKGLPKRLDKTGKPIPGTGIEQVQLDFSTLGKTTLTNSLGQKTTYTHAIVGNEYRLLKVTGAGCASCGESNIKYGYDTLGRLIEHTRLSPNGQPLATTQTERDTLGRPIRNYTVAIINGKPQPRKLQVRYEYAGATSQLVLIARPSVVAGKEHTIKISYNAQGQPTQVTETGFSPLDDNGQTAATPISRTTTYVYSSINGRSLLSQIDGPLKNGPKNSPADSDITRIEWDGRGDRMVSVTHPMNLTESVEYDEAGRPFKLTGADGVVTETRRTLQGQALAIWRYPVSLDRQAAQSAGLLLVTTTRYDILGRAVQIIRADGQGLTLDYDVNGKLARLSDTLGHRVEWKDWNKGAPSDDGKVTTQQWFMADAPQQVARAWYFWHDRLGRLTQRLAPDGGVDEWRYPDHGQPDNSVASADNSTASTNGWFTHIDPLGRLTAQARNSNGTATVRIAPDGEIDARLPVADTGKPLQIQDDFGRIVRFESAQHGIATARYNAAGQIVRIVQADSARIDYTLDAAGRPTQKTAKRAGTAPATVRFHYAAQGLARVDDSAQITAYGYDALGRQTEKRIILNIQNTTQRSYSIRTRYDAHGRVHARQLADGNWLVFTPHPKTGLTQTITLHHPILPGITDMLARWFNAPGLPLMIATRKTVVTDIEANPLDGITRYVNGNGTVTDYRFDMAGRLTGIEDSIRTDKTTGAIFKASYQYDAGRRLVAEKRHVDKQNADKQNAHETTYRYAGWDRLAVPAQAQPTQAAKIPTPAIPLQRDPAGRTEQDAQFRYTYDVWGKLQSVTNAKDNKIIVTYTHNAYGERVNASYAGDGKADAGQTSYYLYDNQKRVAEIDQDGRVLQQYLYLNDTPVAVLDSTGDTELVALHTDRRGAPVAASDEDGKVIWTASYGAWGRAKVQTVSTAANDATFQIDLRLPGQWEDRATHLHYNYQRDYDPGTGRYLTPDPLGFPDGPDAYLYVGGDPINKVDPLGLYETDIHYYMTYFLARMAGVDAQTAYTIALGAQFIDDNPVTWPLDPQNLAGNVLSPAAIVRLASYHFTTTSLNPLVNINYDPPRNTFETFYKATHFGHDYISYIERRIKKPTNPQLTLLTAAYGKASNRCAKAQLFGEYLHAFEDAFGHRNQDNEPIDVNGGFGHGTYWHDPDMTYNHVVTLSDVMSRPGKESLTLSSIGNWDQNEARTLEMEKEVFNKMGSTWGTTGKNQLTGNAITFNTIQNFLKSWNKIQDEGQKITELNFKLAEMGFETIPTYDKKCAGAKRDEYIGGLKQSDYPGVLLPDKNELGKSGTVKQACGG